MTILPNLPTFLSPLIKNLVAHHLSSNSKYHSSNHPFYLDKFKDSFEPAGIPEDQTIISHRKAGAFSDRIWDICAPLLQGPGTFEDKLALICLILVNQSEKNRKRSLELLGIVVRAQIKLGENKKNLPKAESSQEKTIDEKLQKLRIYEQEIQERLKTGMQTATNEIQHADALSRSQHDIILNSIRSI